MKKEFRSFEDARKFVQKLNLKTYKEWKNYCKSNNIPEDIPRAPDQKYKDEWISWGDFLGTGRIATNLRTYRGFEDTRKFVHSLKLKNANEWRKYGKSGKKPDDINSHPYEIYKDEWISWGDFLGTGRISDKERSKNFRTFEKAREFAQSLNLKTGRDWNKFCVSDKKPSEIPTTPQAVYKNKGWISMGDWLSTGSVSSVEKSKNYLSFSDAKKVVKELSIKYKIKNWNDWEKAYAEGKIPNNIPLHPEQAYSKKRLVGKKGK